LSNEVRLRRAAGPALALLLAAALGGCRLWRLERQLGPVDAEFLNKVRYIVTAEERRIFLELPPSDRAAFIDEFWKRRDPDPETEENEFKDEYFSRMREADRLFLAEGIPGWMTDRGRILILFGPPTDRIIETMSNDPSARCLEVWYYGNFPVVFTDPSCTGRFELVTYDLTAISGLNLAYLHALNQAQAELQSPPPESKKRFDVRARLTGAARTEAGLRAVLVLEVPYDRLWFRSDARRLATELDTTVAVLAADRTAVREWTTTTAIVLEEEELRAKWGKSHTIEIPIAVEAADEMARLGSGPVFVQVTVTNRTGNEISRKMLEFR
jgi:GWxTD domain-containing protein